MNELAIVVTIILFPGIIATVIADKIIVHVKPWNSFKFGTYSFILGIGCYVVIQLIFPIVDLASSIFNGYCKYEPLSVWSLIKPTSSKINHWEVFFATLISPIVAFGAAFLINHKIFHKIARFFRVSIKYGDENLFTYYLNAEETDWIYVRDPDGGLTYQGRIISYSEKDTLQELVLSEVTVYSYAESEELYSIPTIYLSRTAGSLTIESIPTENLEEI